MDKRGRHAQMSPYHSASILEGIVNPDSQIHRGLWGPRWLVQVQLPVKVISTIPEKERCLWKNCHSSKQFGCTHSAWPKFRTNLQFVFPICKLQGKRKRPKEEILAKTYTFPAAYRKLQLPERGAEPLNPATNHSPMFRRGQGANQGPNNMVGK